MAYNSKQSNGLAYYLNRGTANVVDFNVVETFVNSGANPLVCRKDDGCNLFEIASFHQWGSKGWLKLIDICKASKVTPDKFTEGLAHYLTYRKDGLGIDLQVVNAFVNNGANPLVSRYSGDGSNLFGIGSNSNWSSEGWVKIIKTVDLYEHCIKSSSATPISKTFIHDFDQELEALSMVIAEFKKKPNLPFKFEQDYKAASIVGEKLLTTLAKHRDDYKEGKITVDEFRIKCGAKIKSALRTDLAKQHVIYQALVLFLNLILALTLVAPIATKITTGRWGLFANSETATEKSLRKMADNLRGLADSENTLINPASL